MWLKAVALLISLTFSSIVSSAPVEGKISSVDLAKRQFTLLNSVYYLPSEIPIKTSSEPGSETLKLADLRKGDFLRIIYTRPGKNNVTTVLEAFFIVQ